jgi:hypothetical protein
MPCPLTPPSQSPETPQEITAAAALPQRRFILSCEGRPAGSFAAAVDVESLQVATTTLPRRGPFASFEISNFQI